MVTNLEFMSLRDEEAGWELDVWGGGGDGHTWTVWEPTGRWGTKTLPGTEREQQTEELWVSNINRKTNTETEVRSGMKIKQNNSLK